MFSTKSRIQNLFGLLLLSLGTLSIACWAQVESGRIVGSVTDPNHSAVPNATITVTNAATNEATTVSTNSAGSFTVTPLNPGVYNVSVKAAGFQTFSIQKLEVQVNQSARADAELQMGSTSTTIEVTAAAPLLNTEAGSLGTVVTNTEIVNLPLNGRSFYDLAKLTPGAATLPGGGNLLRIRANYISGTAISGVRGSQTTFLLDGVDVTDHHQGGTLIQTSIDDLQEFSVQQNAYSAEFGSAGGILNMTSKSGARQFHGGIFEFLRNEKLDARDFFAPRREALKRNQFGGTLGGPLDLPRLLGGKGTFFFVNYEGMRQRQGLVFNDIVPTAAMKAGNFSAPGLNAIYDPLTTANGTRTPFTGNIIPTNRLAPQALFFNRYIPDPNSGTRTAAFVPRQSLDIDQFTIRGDRALTEKHRLFLRWSFDSYREADPNAYPALGYAPLETRAQNVVAGVTSTLTPTLVHEVRFSYLPQSIDLQAFGQGTNFNAQAGITGLEGLARPGLAGSFPDFAWSGYTTLAGSAFDQRPKTQQFRIFQGIDNLTWLKGRHVLKFGVEIRNWQPLFTDSSNYQGSWSFTGIQTQNPARTAGTGDAFADYLLGFPASSARAYPADTFGGMATYSHFFFQDDFKVTSRLTLNLGLRYEYSPWMQGYRNQLGTFNGALAKPIIVASSTNQIDLTSQFAAPTAYALFGNSIQTSGQAGLPLSITSTDLNQWAPRFGLAWRPFGSTHTVIRGGYGIFYEMENTDGRVNRNILPFLLSETIFATTNAVPNRTLGNFFLGSTLGSAGTIPNINPTYTHLRRGADQHWNFGVQQQLTHDTVLEVNYVGNHGTHLNSTNPFNDPRPAAGAIQARRPYPAWGLISYFSQDMSSDYEALQVKAEKRFGSGLWYLLSYTYSKSLVIQDTPAAGGDFYFEKARASFDIPQNLAFNIGYELPFGKGRRFMSNTTRLGQTLVGGWRAQGILVVRSGQPFTPSTSRDVANTGIGSQRPNITGAPLVVGSPSCWFYVAANAACTSLAPSASSAFALPANLTYGNAGANILRSNALRNFDFSVFKEFPIRESSLLQFRAEFFNLSNTVTFGIPNAVTDTSSGGLVTNSVNNPRQIQFGLKYNF